LAVVIERIPFRVVASWSWKTSDQMASSPDSPVLIRMASSMLETKIFPSPIRPVWGTTDRLDGFFDHVVAEHNLDLYLGEKIHDVFGAAIELRVPFLPAKALGLGDRDALQADLLQRLLHLVELEGLDDGLNLLHRGFLPWAGRQNVLPAPPRA